MATKRSAPTTTSEREPDHPAKYSKEIMPVVHDLLNSAFSPNQDEIVVFDPFGGVGGIHELSMAAGRYVTIPSELEFLWARQSLRPAIQADALMLPLRRGAVDAVVTSPCYGNRMADHHDNQDACSDCLGEGEWFEVRKLFTGQTMNDKVRCKKCKGSGKSVRNTYFHKYGETLRPQSAATMQWGLEYRNFHYEAWCEVNRILEIDDPFVLNVSNHIRVGEEIPVTEWHVDTIQEIGFSVEKWQHVETRRNSQGANGQLRVDHESVILFKKKADHE